MHVLSHPEYRALHDLHLHRTVVATATFWTTCPHCWNLFEYLKSNHVAPLAVYAPSPSGRVRHAAAVKLGDAVVEGEKLRQYYSCEASVLVMCYEVQTEGLDNACAFLTSLVHVSSSNWKITCIFFLSHSVVEEFFSS
ncbi:hypothetical protein Fmac_010451 [Flemingia macrophylla]|uniref:Uncharacterized protein n=1 Tax=Flemingia macrophylla TaxID=520843 RepID=A0ABD1MLS5_9FABA